jgi:general nucleoside transport system ATP-binding protein
VTPPALELRGIHKRFGSVHALRGADFTLARGEIHALLGENGAGKTTLMHVAYGLMHPDAGEILIDGMRTRIGTPRAARAHGIGMVHQHFTAIPALTVAENIALSAGWAVAPAELRRRVVELGTRVGLPLDPDVAAGRLSVGVRQRLEIVKALAADARILLLDEPTAVLAPAETDELLRVVRRFTDAGGSAVLITHKLGEARMGADRVTVLRRGVVTLAGRAADFGTDELAAAMIGQADVGIAPPARTGSPGEVLVRTRALEVARENGYGLAVRGVTLEARGGEILGVAAVEGNGQRELLRAIAGRLRPLRGKVDTPQPVGFIPEDRTTEGLVPELSLAENVALGSRTGDPWIIGARIDWPRLRARTAELLEEYRIVAPGPGVPAATLSGGNQQRVVAARELSRRPRVIVAENPTRGLDVRAAAEIQARLRAAADGGAAVLFYSTDLDEVLAVADRIVVASRGTLTEVSPGAGRAEIGGLMLGEG